MIDQKRNEKFWEACGYTSKPTVHKVGVVWPTETGRLPDPSDLSFTGYLLRDGLAAIREKYPCELLTVELSFYQDGEIICSITKYDDYNRSPNREFDGTALTLSKAMFLAFEKALGLDKEEK